MVVSLKKISLKVLVERFGQSFKRFPLAMLFTLFLTCFIIYRSHGGDAGSMLNFFFIFYPATGAVLAVSLALLAEDFKKCWVGVAVQAIVHVAWLAVSLYLSRFDHFSMPLAVAVAATVFFMGLSVFIVCFYRRNQDVPFWNFSIRTLVAGVVAFAIGALLTLGLFALLGSLNLLFGLKVKESLYGDIAAVCMVLLAPALLMNQIPKGRDKYLADLQDYPLFSKGVVQYLFMPLLGLYMITLYAYAIMILVQWTLPVGGVSYLVSGSMVLMVLLHYVTYPLQCQEGNELFKRLTRWLPVLLIPLLALMTVAIGRRLSDYGITVSRLYLLVFNVWCYAVCLWLIVTRNKRIWLIPASFAIILFFISVGPQSIPNVTQRQLKEEARTAFMATGFKQFPITGEQYEQWLEKADPKVARSIDSKLHYLNTDYGYVAISDLLDQDVITGRFSSIDEKGDIVSVVHQTYANEGMIRDLPMPQGYSLITNVTGSDEENDGKVRDKVVFKVNDGKKVEHQFDVDVKQLAAFDREKNPDGIKEPLAIDNGEALLVIDEFYINVYSNSVGYFNFSGILFTK